MGEAALAGNGVLAVTVHRDRQHRVGELPTGVVVVEEQLGVEDCVREVGTFALGVGVGDGPAAADEGVGEAPSRFSVAVERDLLVARQVPDVVLTSGVEDGERVHLDVGVGQHAEGRDDFLAEVLVLVVPPHDEEVGVELVKGVAAAAKVVQQGFAVPRSGGRTAVVGPLVLHRLRPVRGVLHLVGDVGVAQGEAEQSRHVLVLAGEEGVVGHAQSEESAAGGHRISLM